MDILSLAGLVLGLVAILGGSLAKGAGLSALWNFAAFLIVIVGTLGAVLLQSGLPTVKRAMKIARWIVQPPADDRKKLIAQIVDWAGTARKQGLLGLESQVARQPIASLPRACRCWSMASSRRRCGTCSRSRSRPRSTPTPRPPRSSKPPASTRPLSASSVPCSA